MKIHVTIALLPVSCNVVLNVLLLCVVKLNTSHFSDVCIQWIWSVSLILGVLMLCYWLCMKYSELWQEADLFCFVALFGTMMVGAVLNIIFASQIDASKIDTYILGFVGYSIVVPLYSMCFLAAVCEAKHNETAEQQGPEKV